MSFKIAYCAGHYSNTPGKRCLASLDPNETREWVLNDRVADHFARAALEYEGVELLRTDDSTGKSNISIESRTKKANDWGADLYVDMHHNAGINGGSGGGVVAFCYPGSSQGKKYRDAIYEAVIAAGGLKGNRSQPLQEKKFDSLALTDMTAVLVEYGFMDSRTDAPVILDEAYSKVVAYATMEGIAKVAGLKKVAPVQKPEPTSSEKLVVDGKWGKKTTIRLQQIFGTTVDGKVSNQWAKYKESNPGLGSCFDWKEKPNGKGSQLIKAMQKWAGMPANEQDGEIGPKTIKAFQKKLGTTMDGKVSKPSQMVKALQRWANEQ